MPWPIRPAPSTPTFEISISLVSRRRQPFRAPGDYMPLVETEDRGAVPHIVMARPEKRNALSGEVIRELGGAAREAAAGASVRGVIVRGAGARFSSGMDRADLRTRAAAPETRRHHRRASSWR